MIIEIGSRYYLQI